MRLLLIAQPPNLKQVVAKLRLAMCGLRPVGNDGDC